MSKKVSVHCPLCGTVYDASDLAERSWHEDTDETENGLPVCAATAMASKAGRGFKSPQPTKAVLRAVETK